MDHESDICFAFRSPGANVVRKLAVEVHQTYGVGLAGSQLPPHVSLKQPFAIPDLAIVEAYFDQLVQSIEPVVLTFLRIAHELRNELVEELILIGGATVVQNWTVIP